MKKALLIGFTTVLMSLMTLILGVSFTATPTTETAIYTPFTGDMSTVATARNGLQITNPDGALTCGTAPISDADMAAAEAELKSRLASIAPAEGTLTIPVAFHIIMNDAGTQGVVTDQQVADQIDVLNDAFAGESIEFYLLLTTRNNNTTWFNDGGGYFNELAFMPANVLNIYSNSASGALGYVPFLPNTNPGGVGTAADRVVILWSSVPGGSSTNFNEGDTATHEVGHYLGLYHTFQGGCSDPNDQVADTPAISGPNFGCPSPGHDTCNLPGLDDYTNFMDYVDDPCMDHFTAGQFDRMRDISATFRPDLGTVNFSSIYLPIIENP